MAITIYDLYNNQLVTDQPYVDLCIEQIETKISYQISNNLEYRLLLMLQILLEL